MSADTAVMTKLVTDFWSRHWGGLSIGSRRPTSYPEWVTLEVAEGGFATGNALARLGPNDLTNDAFMANNGVEVLQQMLATGKYAIDQPENGALLTLVWLLQQDRPEEAKALMEAISPYSDELRFYPRATTEPSTASSTVGAVSNVAALRQTLLLIKSRATCPQTLAVSFRHNQNRRQRAVAEGYADLQGDAIALILATVAADKVGTLLAAHPSDAACLGNLLFATDMDAEARQVLLERGAALAAAFGDVPSHQRASTTTGMVMAAVANPTGVDRAALARRIVEVAKSRGVKGSSQYEAYIARTRVSAIPDLKIGEKIDRVCGNIASLDGDAMLQDAAVAFCAGGDDNKEKDGQTPATASSYPSIIVRAVNRCVLAPLEELIQKKVIVSAEMIAAVLPSMLAAAAGESIADDAARLLYAQLTVSFSKRRSLLLVNLEKQVRLEELPWARPILSQMRTSDEAKACDVVIKEAIRCYFKFFPATVTPNKLISAMKDVMRKGVSTKANLMEELAADIFQNAFSPNFDAAALVASKMMKNTVYSRYYALDGVYESLEKNWDAVRVEIEELKAKKQAVIDKKKAEEASGDAVDYYEIQTQKVAEVRDAYEAETGKRLYSQRFQYPETPRESALNLAIRDVYQELDYDYVSAAPRCTALVDAYCQETGKAPLRGNAHYLSDQTLNRSPPSTPRQLAADEKIRAIEEEYSALQTEQYNPGYTIQREIDNKAMLFTLAKQKMSDWQMPHNGSSYNSVQGGRTIEAAMVITTHNLAQFVDLIDGVPVNFAESAFEAWRYVVSTFVSPPTERRALLHARRDAAYAWRQILFFITRAGAACGDDAAAAKAAQHAIEVEMRAIVETRARKPRPEAADLLIKQFLDPLIAVIDGAVNTIPGGGKIEDGVVVLGYYGWRAFKSSTPGGNDDAVAPVAVAPVPVDHQVNFNYDFGIRRFFSRFWPFK